MEQNIGKSYRTHSRYDKDIEDCYQTLNRMVTQKFITVEQGDSVRDVFNRFRDLVRDALEEPYPEED